MIRRFSKKLVVGVVMSATLLFGASSASAYDGWADTPQTAYSLNGPINGVSSTINSGADVDWYKFEFAPNSPSYTVSLQSPAGYNYDFYVLHSMDGINFTQWSLPDDMGAGAIDSVDVPGGFPLGFTLYFQVRGQTKTDYSPTVQYVFSVSRN